MSGPLNKQRLSPKAVWALGVVLTLGLVLLAWISWIRASYPSDHEPMGAYVRIVEAVTRDRPGDFFAYIEDAAQHACFTIRDYRKTALQRVMATFPEAERKEYERRYGALAAAADGPEVFALYAREEGWLDLLERDLSRAASVEVQGERASVVTVRGTRYAFRKRSGGIWGLTAFSPKLTSEAERAARDLAMIEKAALDYERAR